MKPHFFQPQLICGLLISAGFMPHALSAADESQQIIYQQQLAQQLQNNRRLKTNIGSMRDNLLKLHQVMTLSGVLDPNVLEQVDAVVADINQASEEEMQQVLRLLISARQEKSAINQARIEQGETVDRLLEAKRNASIRAERARIMERARRLTDELSQLQQETLEEANEQLAGEEPNTQEQQQLADDQRAIADRLDQLAEDLDQLQEQEENSDDIPDVPDEASEQANEIAEDIENGDLFDAAQDQQELLDQLQNMRDQLEGREPEDQLADTPLDSDMQQALDNLADALADQATDIEDFADEYDGDDMQTDEEFQDLLAAQNELNDQLGELGDNEALQDAQDAMEQAQEALAQNDLEAAQEANEQAQQALEQARQEMQQQQQQQMAQQQQEMQQQQQPQMPMPPSEEPHYHDNSFATNGEADNESWSQQLPERERRTMMQGQQEPAPPAYADDAEAYFQALAKGFE